MHMQTGNFEYYKDKEKTDKSRVGKYFTVGDVGYLDEDGYLFLCDRKADMIISGGANIYPAEIESVLLTHPKVGDAAVFGIPHDDWGEEVKAVIEPAPGVEPGDALADEILVVLPRQAGQVQDAEVDRLRDRDAPRPQRQALQAQAARSVLGGARASDLMARLPIDPHEIYVTGDPAEDEPRARKHELVRADEAGHRRRGAARHLRCRRRRARRAGRRHARPRRPAGGAAEPARARAASRRRPYPDSALLERSGIAGRSNPLASPLHMWFEGDKVRGWAVYTDPYEGPAGCLHGGFIAAAFDDLLGFAQMASGQAGYTGTLIVRMRRPTPLNRRLDYEAGVDRVEGRKIWVWGTCHDGDELLSEAEIVFISPKDGSVPR